MIAQKNGVSATGLQAILGIGSYKTAWIWLHKLRTLMVFPNRDKLSGKVEIDETFVGGVAEGKRGRGVITSYSIHYTKLYETHFTQAFQCF